MHCHKFIKILPMRKLLLSDFCGRDIPHISAIHQRNFEILKLLTFPFIICGIFKNWSEPVVEVGHLLLFLLMSQNNCTRKRQHAHFYLSPQYLCIPSALWNVWIFPSPNSHFATSVGNPPSRKKIHLRAFFGIMVRKPIFSWLEKPWNNSNSTKCQCCEYVRRSGWASLVAKTRPIAQLPQTHPTNCGCSPQPGSLGCCPNCWSNFNTTNPIKFLKDGHDLRPWSTCKTRCGRIFLWRILSVANWNYQFETWIFRIFRSSPKPFLKDEKPDLQLSHRSEKTQGTGVGFLLAYSATWAAAVVKVPRGGCPTRFKQRLQGPIHFNRMAFRCFWKCLVLDNLMKVPNPSK